MYGICLKKYICVCDKAIHKEANLLEFVPDYLKTQEMCEEAVHNGPYLFESVPDGFNTQVTCIKEVYEDPWYLCH